eukprot:CCRYP_006472-RA/>CCRYP_006472-RA protein AED:0.42 eAED:0.47 QI:0/-1/0/1/-1/1/1/0/213
MEAAGDFLVNSKVLLPVGNSQELGRVLRWKQDADGKVVGAVNHNPALDTRVYEVRFPDGRTEELAANVIAEAVYAQCDADGNQYVLLDAIVDYRKDPSLAVARDDKISIVDGKKIIKSSTHGWELCCEWKDGRVPPTSGCQVFICCANFLMSRHLTGGSAGSSRRETGLSPWLSAEALDTTNTLTNMGLKSLSLLRKRTPSTGPQVLPFGTMQ